MQPRCPYCDNAGPHQMVEYNYHGTGNDMLNCRDCDKAFLAIKDYTGEVQKMQPYS